MATRHPDSSIDIGGAGPDFGPRYRLGTPLGEGGMSQVVRAYDRARREEVALKILSPSGPEIALSSEFRYIASLNHPGVVEVYDFGLTADGRPFFTMEMMEDGDLLAVAERAGLRTMLLVVREVFRTLDFVHSRGVVHADIKPSNVMVGRTRDGEHYPKLLDFGIAWEDVNQQAGGTVHFMAPELFMRTFDRDHRSDLYAMGVVMFEMLTGELPFNDDSPVRLAQAHISTPPPDPRDFWSQLPGELAELVLRLLEKKPRDRFQRGREVVGVIDGYLTKQPDPGSKRRIYSIAEPEVRIAGGSRFVGYKAELDRLLDATQELADGGSIYIVTGEAGSGKTRLLNELRIGAQLRGVASLTVDLEAAQTAVDVVNRIATTITGASAVDVRGATRPSSLEPVSGGDRVILDAERLAAAGRRMAEARPVVFSIEGLSELPEDAVRALRAFTVGVVRAPALVVMTARGRLEGPAETFAAVEHAEHLSLRRVSREACGELVRSLLGDLEGEDIVDHVHRESGGNPGAIERVVGALAAIDAIVPRRDGWSIAPELGGRLPTVDTEVGLRKIAAATTARLAPNELEVARAAAHVGETCPHAIVDALFPNNASEALNQLVGLQVLEPVDESLDLARRKYRISQRAVRELLLEDLDDSEAKRLSHSIVDALSEEGGADVPFYAVTLARHLIALGSPQQALETLDHAVAATLSPSLELVSLLRAALAEEDVAGDDDGLWCRLATSLADIDRRQGRSEEALQGFRAVVERAGATRAGAAARRELGDLMMMHGDDGGEAELEQALQSARNLEAEDLVGMAAYTLANRLVVGGRHEAAAPHLAEALTVAEASADQPLQAMTLKLRATLNWFRGNYEDAETDARRAVERYGELGSPQGVAVSLGALANTLFTRGRMDEARQAYAEALVKAQEAGWLTGVGKLEASLAATAYHNDDWDIAFEHFEAAIAILERTGNYVDQLIPMYSMGFVAAKRGDTVAGRQYCERALELARRVGYRKGEADALSNLGELALQVGALDEADAFLEDALRIAEEIGAVSARVEGERRRLEVALARYAGPLPVAQRAEALGHQAEEASLRAECAHAERVRGIALARTREPEEALTLLRKAHDAFDELGSKYEAARTVRIIAELTTQGLVFAEGVENQLRKACRVFRRLRAQPELDAARVIRDRLGIPPSSVSLGPHGSGAPRSSSLNTPTPSSSRRPPSSSRESAWVHTDASEPEGQPDTLSSHDRITQAPLSDLERAPTRTSVPSLSDVSRQLSEILELDELLACIADAAIASSEAQRGFVIACDRTGQPALRVSRGLGGLDLDDDLELSRSAVARVIAKRERVQWQADRPMRRHTLGESVSLLGLQAVLALPMINRGRLWGVLYVDTRDPNTELTGSNAAHLEALAAHGAVAIQNARLFEENTRKNELIASAINELRHPIDTLQRCAEVAYQQSENEATQRLNETVKAHAHRLGVKVARLLELATTEPSKVHASKVSVHLRDLVDAATLQLRPVKGLDDTPLEVEVPWSLPTILGHREQLIQVLASMLAAALRGAGGEGVRLEAVAVDSPMAVEDEDPFFPPRPMADDDAVQITVSYDVKAEDEGEPLDELGLAIAREIVEHHGGRWTTSERDGRRELVALLPSLLPS